MLKRIEHSLWWKFHGGIHPPQQKFLTNDKPIRNLPLPSQLILPLRQHIGNAAKLLVNVGDSVLKGQPLTQRSQTMAVPIHAPTSGIITAIRNTPIAHPSGLSEPCIFVSPDGFDKTIIRHICSDHSQLDTTEIIDKITQAGIAGMGGAGFPTNIKINITSDVTFLIINAAECEPYITADDLLMREHSSEIIDGIKILTSILKPKKILIAIEDNKPEAIQALKKAAENLEHFQVCVLPTIYPTGGEKQLIQILTGQEIPQGSLPSSLGIVMQNVATCFAIADAVINDIPLIRRVVTVTGSALEKPQNVWALLGTPISHLLEQCGYQPQKPENLIMGGPMMGFSLPDSRISITKISNCILAPSSTEIPKDNDEVDCIRCGQCADVCPSQLLPQELQWFAKAKDHDQLQKFNLFDCIECGACAYVCPSQIPLVYYYRVAKAEIKQNQLQAFKAEKAKARFESRKSRLAQEKIKREEKHRQAAEARKATMNSNTNEAKNAKSAVAAALARVKAKKEQNNNASTSIPNSNTVSEFNVNEKVELTDKKIQVAAAIARAKEKKRANIASKNRETENVEKQNNTIKNNISLDKKTLQQQKQNNNIEVDLSLNTPANTKIADNNRAQIKPTSIQRVDEVKTYAAQYSRTEKIKNAVKKARILQTERQNRLSANTQGDEQLVAQHAVEKKNRIAAAVSKAKKQRQQSTSQQKEST